MHHAHVDPASLDLSRTVRDLGPAATRWPLVIGIGGLVAAVIFAILRALVVDGGDSLERFLFSYLHTFFYFATISFGALFFVLVSHLSRAGWSVTVRRIAEVMAANLVPTFALLFLPVLACAWTGTGLLFPWTDADVIANNPVIAHKTPYLNPVFFTIRAVIYFAIFWYLGHSLLRDSVRQDETGEPQLSRRTEVRSSWGTLVTFLVVTFASIDWVMSLDPEWYSTMFGVYVIAGSALSFFAALWVIVYVIQAGGLLRDLVTVEHQHDIGKYVFGFIIFWTYITFCQFLLIWYADIPEETQWFLVRQNGGWQWVGLILIVGHFAIPFLGIMSRFVKRNRRALLFWCVWILVMHWFDTFYMVMPESQPVLLPGYEVPGGAAPGLQGETLGLSVPGFVLNLLMDLAMLLGIGGITIAGLVWTAAGHALVPTKDPRLAESLAFQNV